GCPEVDDKLIFCRLLERQIARLLALKNTVDIAGGLAKHLDAIGAIKRQAPDLGKARIGIDRREVVPPDKRDDLFAQVLDGDVGGAENAGTLPIGQVRERALDIAEPVDGNEDRLNRQRNSGSLEGPSVNDGTGIVGIVDESNSSRGGRDLL